MIGTFNMKEFVVPAKSRGVLLFAFNTDVDYVKIAERSARLIQHNLKLPVTLITDQTINNNVFDQVIVVEHLIKNNRPGKSAVWRNVDRYRAYELSPYDETILMDSDYLILDNSLLKLFEQNFDYRIMTYNQTVDGPWQESMGFAGLNYQWATVVLFRKTPVAQMLFNLVGRVQRNYNYYTKLYHTRADSFRNDYAFTMAYNMLNGYDQGLDQGIPWPMLTLDRTIGSMTIKNNMLQIKEQNRAHVIPKQNVHVMDKDYLLTNDFLEFVEAICAE